MSTFFALLSVVALAGAAVAVVALAGGDRTAGLRAAIARNAPLAVAAVMVTATLGSLYYSEIVGFQPCRLCWFQRIFAYPMAIIFVVALLQRLRRGAGSARLTDVWAHTLPLAAIGLGVSTWHVAIQRLPSLSSGACDATAPCSAVYVSELGVFSIPLMAGTAFVLVLTWGAVALLAREPAPAEPPAASSARRTQ